MCYPQAEFPLSLINRLFRQNNCFRGKCGILRCIAWDFLSSYFPGKSLHVSEVADPNGRFCSMKRVGLSISSLLGWDASPSQGYPDASFGSLHKIIPRDIFLLFLSPGGQQFRPLP